jgi:hypothetical protein
LVLLDGDPLRDITNTRKINAVILHGQFFSKQQILGLRGK